MAGWHRESAASRLRRRSVGHLGLRCRGWWLQHASRCRLPLRRDADEACPVRTAQPVRLRVTKPWRAPWKRKILCQCRYRRLPVLRRTASRYPHLPSQCSKPATFASKSLREAPLSLARHRWRPPVALQSPRGGIKQLGTIRNRRSCGWVNVTAVTICWRLGCVIRGGFSPNCATARIAMTDLTTNRP